MHSIFALIIMAVLMIWNPSAAIAEGIMIDDFKSQPETRWRFIADTVMGGVSSGKVSFFQEDGQSHARMVGSVSTKNNGGFIQFRTKLPSALPKLAVGLRLVVRGNDQRYFVHLRTSGTLFAVAVLPGWLRSESRVVRSAFDLRRFQGLGGCSSGLCPRPENLKSVGIVAFWP